ncbi:MAG: tetratricopeptide repeat protein [bacterium]|nr:tetratricopeptide repeat protein [bacterium]
MTEYFLVFLFLLLVAAVFYIGYERLFRRSSKPDSSLYVDALRELLDGRQESAFTKLRQVVAEDSTNLDAYIRLGLILRDNNRPERAVQVHRDLTLRPGLTRSDRVSILRQLASDYLALEDIKMADAALNELISMNPDDHWAHTQLLALQEKAQLWNAAYETAVHILHLEANKSKKPLARFKYLAGEQLFRKREYHKARILLKEAIGLDPTYTAAYLAIGDSYCEEDRSEDAVTFWGKLISSVPDQGHLVIDRLKKTFFDLGRYGDIQGVCEAILEHSPKNLEARQALAEFYEKKGDLDQAIDLWSRVIEDYPENMEAVLELIRVYLEKGDQKKIAQLLRTIEHRREDKRRKQPGKPISSDPANPTA